MDRSIVFTAPTTTWSDPKFFHMLRWSEWAEFTAGWIRQLLIAYGNKGRRKCGEEKAGKERGAAVCLHNINQTLAQR